MTEQPAWLNTALAYVPQWLGYQMRSTEQPGCAVAITYQGKVVFDMAWGCADLATGERLTPQHRFRVASHSKSFTAAAILKLREQGRVKLDDTVGTYVTGLHPDVAAATIAQLLSNSAGLFRDGLDSAYWSGRAPFPDAEQLGKDFTLPPVIDTNSRLKYSNHGFALAGLVIEAITGEPYARWIEREILCPAGLADTFPDVSPSALTGLVSGHSDKVLLGRRLVYPGTQSTRALAPATGFISTASDLARFFGQLAPGAANSVLSPASRREMSRPQWRAAHFPVECHYGLGTVSATTDGWAWFGHSGGFQGYITQTAVVPDEEIAISVLTNAADGPADAWLQGVIKILKRFKSEGPPGAAVADWAGRWWSIWSATDLVAMGDKILLAVPGSTDPFLNATELAVNGPDEAHVIEGNSFGIFGERVRRIRDAAGIVTEIYLGSGKVVPEAALAQELLAKYDGG